MVDTITNIILEESSVLYQLILPSHRRTAELSLENFCHLLTYYYAPSSRITFTSSSQLIGRKNDDHALWV